MSADTVRDNLTMWIPEAPDKTLVAVPYKAVEGWLKPSPGEGFTFGGNSGVSAESPDHMSTLQQGKTCLPDPMPDGSDGGILQTTLFGIQQSQTQPGQITLRHTRMGTGVRYLYLEV